MTLHGCPGCGEDIPATFPCCHTCEARLPEDLRVRLTESDPWGPDVTGFLNVRRDVREWLKANRMEEANVRG